MKELQKILRECRTDAEIIAFLAVVILGAAAWTVLCMCGPEWLVRTLSLPMGVVVMNACGKLKNWMEEEGKKQQAKGSE